MIFTEKRLVFNNMKGVPTYKLATRNTKAGRDRDTTKHQTICIIRISNLLLFKTEFEISTCQLWSRTTGTEQLHNAISAVVDHT